MAVAFDAATGGSGTTSNYNFTHTPVGTPTTVFAAVATENGSTAVSGVTYGGVSMVEIVEPTRPGGVDITMAVYKLDSPASGAQTVDVTLAGSATSATVVMTVTGAGARQPSSFNYHIAGSGTLWQAVAPSEDSNALFCGFVVSRTNNTDVQITPDASQTQRASQDGGGDVPRIELTTKAGVVGPATNSWTATNSTSWMATAFNVSPNDGGFGASLAGTAGTVKTPWAA